MGDGRLLIKCLFIIWGEGEEGRTVVCIPSHDERAEAVEEEVHAYRDPAKFILLYRKCIVTHAMTSSLVCRSDAT